MLNELYSLSATLESKGITVEEWHDDYGGLPTVTSKSLCIRLWLAEDGSVFGFESISSGLALLLRKFGNNQNSFPAFNIAPLYRITDTEQIEELKYIEKEPSSFDLDRIKSWCIDDNWKDSLVRKVDNSIHTYSYKLLDRIGHQEQQEYNLISNLVRLTDTFPKKPKKAKQSEQTKTKSDTFRTALEKCVFKKLQKKEDINLALTLLFHKGDSKKDPKKDDGTLSVILDLFDWHQYGYPIASEHTTKWINDKLLLTTMSTPNIPAQLANNGYDAFGMPFVNPNTPMPVVKLDSFSASLRTMFDGYPCQLRYKQINDGSYPISLGNRSLIKKALVWLAKIEHKGVMWQKIDKKEFIFVYPSKLPKVPTKFASIFGTTKAEGSGQTEARFENIAKEFMKTLQGIPLNEKPDYIQIFTIRKTDENLMSTRAKIIFTRRCSSDQLIQSAKNWESGCNNTPGADLGERVIPFPLQVSQIVNNVWKQSGELAQGQSAVERMKYYQGIELLLDIMQKSMICNYLHILLTNSSGLVNYLGNWVHGGSKCKDKTAEKKLEKLKGETVLLLSLLGLLLDKNDNRKEKYMENMAYSVGQLLKISDELHTLYCKVVRSGDVPPQLAGSALFVTAGETPHQAITQLSLRMNPYITWAKQYRFKNIKDEEKESCKAAWYLKLFEDVANKLSLTMADSTKFSDFEKAQLFIGYLASFPKGESSITVTGDNNKNNIGGANNEQ